MRFRPKVPVLDHGIRLVPAALLIIVAAQQTGPLQRSATVASSAVQPIKGEHYGVLLSQVRASSWFGRILYPPDFSENPTASTLALAEDAHPLGPPHSVHQDIFDRGRGRYSKWNGWLYFSAPWANGRTYTIAVYPS